MAITGTFAADFSSFSGAVDKALLKLRGFEEGSVKVANALSRIGNAYSGQRLIQEATLTAEAIERMGGTTKLTGTELQRAGALATEAVNKMKALGIDVPARLQKLSDAAKPIPQQLTLMGRAAELAKSSFGQMFTAFSAASLVDRAVSSLVNFGVAAVDAAGHTVDLAAKLNVSTDAIQRWDFVAKQTGTTVEAFASSAFKLQTRIAGAGGKGPIADALDAMGVSLRDLQGLAPEKQFDAVVGALSRMDNQAEANRLGVVLFGKQFEQMAAAVAQGYETMANEAPRTADAQLRALDKMGDAWQKFKDRVSVEVQGFLGSIVIMGSAVTRAEGFFQKLATLGAMLHSEGTRAILIAEELKAGAGEAPKVPAAPASLAASYTDYAAALKDARAEVAALLPDQRKQIDAALALGASQEDLQTQFHLSDGALKLYSSSVKEHVKDTTAASTAAREWNSSYRTLDATFGKWVQTGTNANATTKSTLDLYTAMPAAIASIDEGLRSDYIPAVQMSDDVLMAMAMTGQRGLTDLGDAWVHAENVGVTAAKALATQSAGLGASMKAGLAGAAKGLGPTIMSAVTGGGSVGKSVGALFGGQLGDSAGEAVGKSLSGALGKTIGGAIGSIIPGLGTMVGSLAGGLFGKLFGKSEHEKVNDMRDAAFSAAGGFEAMNAKAHAAGTTLQKVLDAKTVKAYEAAVGDLQAKLGDFAAEQEADQQRLTAAIEKYGFSLAELGPQLQSSRLNEQAKELIEDWRVLVAAGIDVSTVNAKMAESINTYLQQALKVGAEVPNAMRPVLESMAAQGTLVDANGNAITDLEKSGIKFSETMTEGFDRVVKKLDELIVRLQGAGTAIGNMPKTIDIGVNYQPGTVPSLENAQSLEGYAWGTHGRFLDFQKGTAVTLHGREQVVTEAEGRADAAALASLAQALSGLDRRISQAVGRAVTDALILAPAR